MKKIALLTALVVLLAPSSNAVVIYLKDGSRIKGTVVSSTARDMDVHTPEGMITIANERIDRVAYHEEEPAPPAMAAAAVPVTRRRLDLYQAAYPELPHSFSIGVSGGFPISGLDFQSTGGGSDDNGGAGVSFGGEYLQRLSPRWSGGFNLDYMYREGIASQSLLPASSTDVFGHTLLMMPVAKFNFIEKGAVRPYILGGLGVNRTSTVIESTPDLGFEWSDTHTAETRTLVDQAHWGFASTLRTGLDFYMPWNPQIWSLEFGWTHIANSAYGATAAGQDLGLQSVTGKLDVLTVGMRVGWRF